MTSAHANPGDLTPFDYRPRTRVVFGAGASGRTGEFAKELGGRRVLLVTDPGIVRAGHAGRIRASLEAAGLTVVVYDFVRENPTTQDVNACLLAARQANVDLMVGLGGGSSMDTAKGCNFLLTNGGEMKDYRGVGRATKPMLPLIAIPTTAGTGSECQSAALIADEVTHQKMACLDPKAAARVAILDPELTVSQPRRVTACTGLDAIAHAVETAVTARRTTLSSMYSREAFRLCAGAFPVVLANPGNIEARGRMLLGAAMAGTAIENSMLGAAHAAANPLTARFGIIHGQAVGMMLPGVVRFNAEDHGAHAAYETLAAEAGIAEGVEGLVTFLAGAVRAAELPMTLGSCGVGEDAVEELAAEAATQWTAQFNPRGISAPDFATLYRTLLG
ncbi:MAG TPA: alcohol dehydrogenase [Verrucomicrobiales bacterium]|nr:alcohol dehydrogenase [Verrucomicrobiales bacterium]